jgi:hypothetical protein
VTSAGVGAVASVGVLAAGWTAEVASGAAWVTWSGWGAGAFWSGWGAGAVWSGWAGVLGWAPGAGCAAVGWVAVGWVAVAGCVAGALCRVGWGIEVVLAGDGAA